MLICAAGDIHGATGRLYDHGFKVRERRVEHYLGSTRRVARFR